MVFLHVKISKFFTMNLTLQQKKSIEQSISVVPLFFFFCYFFSHNTNNNNDNDDAKNRIHGQCTIVRYLLITTYLKDV